MTTKIIQARQKNSVSVPQNGEWTTVLTQPLVLNDGAMLSLKNAFIDTQTENSGRVVIPTDTDLTMTYFVYDINDIETPRAIYPASNLGVESQSDGKIYMLQKDIENDKANLVRIAEVRCKLGSPSIIKGHWSGTAQCSYRNSDGHKINAEFKLPSTEMDRTASVFPDYICQRGSFAIQSIDTEGGDPSEEKPDWTLETFNQVPIELGQVFQLKSYQKTVVLKAGDYDPTHLGDEITKLFTEPTTTNPVSLGTDALLKNGKVETNNAQNVFIGDTTANYAYTFPVDEYIGTNQFAFVYDENKSRFTLQYSHFPVYRGTTDEGASGDIVVEFKKTTIAGVEQETTYLKNKEGGIIIADLQPDSFWIDQLGFNATDYQPNILNNQTYTIPTTPTPTTFKCDVIPVIQDGVNITGGFVSLDDFVAKSQDDVRTIVPLNFQSTCVDTYELVASKKFLNGNATNSPYFLIEVNIGDNKLYTENNTINNCAIVSKYYGYNNFTSSGEESAIVYRHKGQPTYINKIKVRILDPDLTLSQQLGDENTVFFQVINP